MSLKDDEVVRGPDYLDGELIFLDEKDQTVSVHLRDAGTIHACTTTSEIAKNLRPHFLGHALRAFGAATWIRNEATGWELQEFFIEYFTPLSDKTLGEALSELERLPSPDWNPRALEEIRSSGSKE